jgi:hypothetical protein
MYTTIMNCCTPNDFLIPVFTDKEKGKPVRYPVEYMVQNLKQHTDLIYVERQHLMDQVPKHINHSLISKVLKDDLLNIDVSRSIDYNKYFVMFSNMLRSILNFTFKVGMIDGCDQKCDLKTMEAFYCKSDTYDVCVVGISTNSSSSSSESESDSIGLYLNMNASIVLRSHFWSHPSIIPTLNVNNITVPRISISANIKKTKWNKKNKKGTKKEEK